MRPVALILAVFFTAAAYGQQQKLYRARIIVNTGIPRVGIVTAIGNSAVQILRIAEAKTGGRDRLSAEWIPVNTIDQLVFRRLNGLKSGALGGAAIGLLLGGVIGNATYEPCDPTPGWLGSDCDWEVMDRATSTVMGALIGAQIGAGVGILIGTAAQKYQINGDLLAYRQAKTALEKYVMR
jgi:uncharacterized protein YcfJ